MSDEEKIIYIGTELRKALFNEMKNFWKIDHGLSIEQIYVVNTVIIASLIVQITCMIFKNNAGTPDSIDYIDKICALAKKQLSDSNGYIPNNSNSNSINIH